MTARIAVAYGQHSDTYVLLHCETPAIQYAPAHACGDRLQIMFPNIQSTREHHMRMSSLSRYTHACCSLHELKNKGLRPLLI